MHDLGSAQIATRPAPDRHPWLHARTDPENGDRSSRNTTAPPNQTGRSLTQNPPTFRAPKVRLQGCEPMVSTVGSPPQPFTPIVAKGVSAFPCSASERLRPVSPRLQFEKKHTPSQGAAMPDRLGESWLLVAPSFATGRFSSLVRSCWPRWLSNCSGSQVTNPYATTDSSLSDAPRAKAKGAH
jgi:hypothetical protein